MAAHQQATRLVCHGRFPEELALPASLGGWAAAPAVIIQWGWLLPDPSRDVLRWASTSCESSFDAIFCGIWVIFPPQSQMRSTRVSKRMRRTKKNKKEENGPRRKEGGEFCLWTLPILTNRGSQGVAVNKAVPLSIQPLHRPWRRWDLAGMYSAGMDSVQQEDKKIGR